MTLLFPVNTTAARVGLLTGATPISSITSIFSSYVYQRILRIKRWPKSYKLLGTRQQMMMAKVSALIVIIKPKDTEENLTPPA